MIRVIYQIQSFTRDGELVMRRFARNKRTAGKIAKSCKRGEVEIRKMGKSEQHLVRLEEVE